MRGAPAVSQSVVSQSNDNHIVEDKDEKSIKCPEVFLQTMDSQSPYNYPSSPSPKQPTSTYAVPNPKLASVSDLKHLDSGDNSNASHIEAYLDNISSAVQIESSYSVIPKKSQIF